MPSLINAAALASAPLLHPWLTAVLSLVGLFALLWNVYIYVRKETSEAKTKTEINQGAIVAAMKVRNDAADAERLALMADSKANKAEHARFQQDISELAESLRSVSVRLQNVELDSAGRKERDAATKDTLARIDGQLTRLVDNFLSRH